MSLCVYICTHYTPKHSHIPACVCTQLYMCTYTHPYLYICRIFIYTHTQILKCYRKLIFGNGRKAREQGLENTQS